MRNAKILFNEEVAGYLLENEEGYHFTYDASYLAKEKSKPVSLTLPLSQKTYRSSILFPFFDGLIPEGWLLEVAERNWKLNERDRMGLLLACCHDCIGSVSVIEDK
jgi:serine/threonine-protein kinase HipA